MVTYIMFMISFIFIVSFIYTLEDEMDILFQDIYFVIFKFFVHMFSRRQYEEKDKNRNTESTSLLSSLYFVEVFF